MAEPNTELQSLNKLHTDVDLVQNNVILASHCIKAQVFLLEKLKNHAKRSKEQCCFINNANMKLKCEITQAQQEIKSTLQAQETIQMANVDLKKELLLVEQKKEDFIRRVNDKEKKYETLWLECKKRYESLPFGQNLLKANASLESSNENIAKLDEQLATEIIEIKTKKETCQNIDQKIIIQLAEFMVRERPKLIAQAQEKIQAIRDLSSKLNSLHIKTVENKPIVLKRVGSPKDIINKSIKDNDEGASFMPRLRLDTVLDFDDLVSLKMKMDLDKVRKQAQAITNKKNTEDLISSGGTESPKKPYFGIVTSTFKTKAVTDKSILTYFNTTKEIPYQDYSKKKLINILEDVKIDANDAMIMISKVNPNTLQSVGAISAEAKSTETESPAVPQNKAAKEPIQSEIIEEIDMTTSNTEDVLIPPTQFLDAVKSQKSQEKKTVSFDLTNTTQNDAIGRNTGTTQKDNVVNETNNSQLNDSAVSDDGYMKIKDMVLKKHKLDLSPQFVYAKNAMLQPLNAEEKVITSKFFGNAEVKETIRIQEDTRDKRIREGNHPEVLDIEVADKTIVVAKNNSRKIIELDVEDAQSSAKKQKVDELCNTNKPSFGGYLFSHGPQGLPDSLDLSLNTTTYEDADFPHCIDSSLLLSPKAFVPMSDDQPAIESQEVPNFLSGLRKTGFSLFGSAGDSKADSSSPNQGTGFSFSFGGEEKKNRGGLFSMFK